MKNNRIFRRSHRWVYQSLKALAAVSLALALGSAAALADEPAKASDKKGIVLGSGAAVAKEPTKDLAKASQNPVAAMISVPIENNATFNNGDEDVFVNVTNIKPVIPMGITENWNLINRLIVPVIYQDDGFMGNHHTSGITSGGGSLATKEEDLGNLFGLGDIVYQGFFSPKKPGKVVWGLGPELHIPTGMERLTTNQWSLGPAAVVLTMPGHWVIGALVSNVWNIGNGYDDAPDVSSMTVQYFINYNMKGGWYLATSPVMTANWEADSGDQWTVPVGGGFGRVFKVGEQHVNMKLSAYYNVEAPDGNDDVWNLQASCTFLFPR